MTMRGTRGSWQGRVSSTSEWRGSSSWAHSLTQPKPSKLWSLAKKLSNWPGDRFRQLGAGCARFEGDLQADLHARQLFSSRHLPEATPRPPLLRGPERSSADPKWPPEGATTTHRGHKGHQTAPPNRQTSLDTISTNIEQEQQRQSPPWHPEASVELVHCTAAPRLSVLRVVRQKWDYTDQIGCTLSWNGETNKSSTLTGLRTPKDYIYKESA